MTKGHGTQPGSGDWETVRETAAYAHELRSGEHSERDLQRERGRLLTETSGPAGDGELAGRADIGKAPRSGGDRLLSRATGVLAGGAFVASLFVDWAFWLIWAVVGAGLILGIAKRLGGTVTRKRGQEPTETLLQEHGMHLERRERGQRGKSPDNLGASDPVSRTRGSSLPKRI